MRRSALIISIICVLPASKLKNAILRRCGFRIGQDVVIQPILLLRVGAVSLANSVRIGPFNVIRDVDDFVLGERSVIGQWNWISGAVPLRAKGAPLSFRMGQHSALTSRHYLDASGGIEIGNYTTVAGVRSTFITHGIDWRTSSQTVRPIRIGDYCIIGSNTAVSPGTEIGNHIVVGMGGCLQGSLPEARLIVSPRGVPVGRALRGSYFSRTTGFVE